MYSLFHAFHLYSYIYSVFTIVNYLFFFILFVSALSSSTIKLLPSASLRVSLPQLQFNCSDELNWFLWLNPKLASVPVEGPPH